MITGDWKETAHEKPPEGEAVLCAWGDCRTKKPHSCRVMTLRDYEGQGRWWCNASGHGCIPPDFWAHIARLPKKRS